MTAILAQTHGKNLPNTPTQRVRRAGGSRHQPNFKISCPREHGISILEPSMTNEHNSLPCAFGFGRILRWPWALHMEPLGYCGWECHCDVFRRAHHEVLVASALWHQLPFRLVCVALTDHSHTQS